MEYKVRTIFIKPTNLCNLRCKHCFVSEEDRQDTRKMSLEEINYVFSQIQETFKPSDVKIVFHGGEPMLLGVDFYQKIYEKWGNTFDFILQTNLMLYDDSWDFVIEKMFKGVIGTSYGFERQTSKGFFDFDEKWKEKYWQAKKKFKVSVRFTVTKLFLSKPVNFWIDFLEKYSPDGFAFDWYVDVPERQDLYVSYDECLEFLKEFTEKWYEKNREIDFFPLNLRKDRPLFGTGFNTYCASHTLVIDPDGSVGICPALMSDGYFIGNIFKQSLSEILQSKERLSFIAMQQSVPEECVSCEYLSVCNTGCLALRILNLMQRNKCKEFFAFLENMFERINAGGKVYEELCESQVQ